VSSRWGSRRRSRRFMFG